MKRRKKHLFASLLAAILLLALTACASSMPATINPADAEADEIPDWQTQYDLGVRYLSEGNYEEAIIAFTAAIEIEPKQAELYLYRARAYNAIGDSNAQIDYETALLLDDTLVEAYRALIWIYREAEEYDKLADLLERARAATGDPYFDTLNQYGYEKFEFRGEYVSPEDLTDDQRNTIESVLTAAEAGDAEAMMAAVLSSDFFYSTTDNYPLLCTIWEGKKIRLYSTAQSYEKQEGVTSSTDALGIVHRLSVEIRPENGIGNYYEAEIGDNGYLSYRKTECSCVDWQWNGAMTASERRIDPEYSYSSSSATLIYYYYDSHAEGFLVNNAVNGEFYYSSVLTRSSIPGLVVESTSTRNVMNGASDTYMYTYKSNAAEAYGGTDDNIEEVREATVEGAGISYMGEHGFWAGTIASY